MDDPPATSEELMVRVSEGDTHAFETLVARHQGAILNFIYRFMGDRQDAEDLAQEVFLRVWRAAPAYEPTAKFTTWIYRIAANLCINRQRSLRLRRWLVLSLSGERKDVEYGFPSEDTKRPLSPEDLLFNEERKRKILSALRQLPANQRVAVILRKYEGLSYQEIARVMGRTVSSVDSLLVRAKRTLSKKLASLEK